MITNSSLTNMPDPHHGHRGYDFWPSVADLAAIPALYETDGTGPLGDRVVHLHYFIGGCHWWLIELNPVEGLAFGYVSLGDQEFAEWGSIDLEELAGIYEPGMITRRDWGFRVRPTLILERDLDWRPRPAREVLPSAAWEWND